MENLGKKITVIGAGYVGLVTSVCLAEMGNTVLCVEKSSAILKKLNMGIVPIYEPDLAEMLKKNIDEGRLFFTAKMDEGVKFSNIIFICVGTPESRVGKADLFQVEVVARQIAELMDDYKLIVEKSTVPVNTHKLIKRTIKWHMRNDFDFNVASNPEFLREGYAIYDFLNPDRIVIGVDSKRAENILRNLYIPLTGKGTELLITKTAAAEMIKYASNSFLAIKISYINMLADLCEKVDVDIDMVADGIGLDKRIGREFLNAGIGYGGSCIPKDVNAFIKMAENYEVNFGILKETEKINQDRRKKILDKLKEVLWVLNDKNIAIWGLAFKPDTDDIRDAPSIDIVKCLLKDGASIKLYDPVASDNFKKIFPENYKINYNVDKYDALKNADSLLILTEWPEFIRADVSKIKELMRLPIVIDGRNVYNSQIMENEGIEYYSIGRKSVILK